MKKNMLQATIILAFFLVSVTTLYLHPERDTLDETLDKLIEQAEESGINKTILPNKSSQDSKIVYLNPPSSDKQKISDNVKHGPNHESRHKKHNIKHGAKSEKEDNNSKENDNKGTRRMQPLAQSRSGHERYEEYTETRDDYTIEIEPILENPVSPNVNLRAAGPSGLSEFASEFEKTNNLNDRNVLMSDEDDEGYPFIQLHGKDNLPLNTKPDELIEILSEFESDTFLGETTTEPSESPPSVNLHIIKQENKNHDIENTADLDPNVLKVIKELLEEALNQNMEKEGTLIPNFGKNDRMVKVTDDDLMNEYRKWLSKKGREDKQIDPNRPLADIYSPLIIPELEPNPISIASLGRLATIPIINTPEFNLSNNRRCITCHSVSPLLAAEQNWKNNQFMTHLFNKMAYRPGYNRFVYF